MYCIVLQTLTYQYSSQKLRHEHLVNMIEVFRRKRRFYLVFEYLDHTLLDELEASPGGLGEPTAKKHLYQLLKGIDFCHQNSVCISFSCIPTSLVMSLGTRNKISILLFLIWNVRKR